MTQQTPTPSQAQHAVLSPEQTIRELDRLIESLSTQYGLMLGSLEEHEFAMRNADAVAMATCIAKENEAVQAIAELDKRRAHIVSLYKKSNGLNTNASGEEVLTITMIARRIGGEAGGALARRASELKELVQIVRARSAALHSAAEMLGSHTAGIMRQVVQLLNHAQVYSRGGAVTTGPAVTTALDITS